MSDSPTVDASVGAQTPAHKPNFSSEFSAVHIEIRGLRRRVHMLEGHNQHFERCESAWCHPEGWHGPGDPPALEMGRYERWPAGPGEASGEASKMARDPLRIAEEVADEYRNAGMPAKQREVGVNAAEEIADRIRAGVSPTEVSPERPVSVRDPEEEIELLRIQLAAKDLCAAKAGEFIAGLGYVGELSEAAGKAWRAQLTETQKHLGEAIYRLELVQPAAIRIMEAGQEFLASLYYSSEARKQDVRVQFQGALQVCHKAVQKASETPSEPVVSARDAAAQQMAEALEDALADLLWVDKARAALQAYREATK